MVIKKYNENWENGDYDIKVTGNDTWQSAYKKAKNIAVAKNKEVRYVFNKILHVVTSKTDGGQLFIEFLDTLKKAKDDKQLLTIGETPTINKTPQVYFKINDFVKVIKNGRTAEISDYDEKDPVYKYLVIYENGTIEWLSYDDIELIRSETKNSEKYIEYEGIPVVGLPSGQIIYMTDEQLIYFKARNYVRWTETWKKPMSGARFEDIMLKCHTFDDDIYDDLIIMSNKWR